MSRKVIDITHSATKYDILSQTPKNYDKDNYFLKELQDKVNIEWKYRPNRVNVEYENAWGKQTYTNIEVVVQSVLSEKGTAISNDTRNLVFKNILEDRFNIGSRFRFSEDYDLSKEEDKKNVWMVVNQNKVNMTSSVVIERCNGTLGSMVDNGNGTVSYHYEPVIQGKTLTSVNFFYNETLLSPQSQLLVIAQHNEFTRQYKTNQRFVIGYDKVYRIKAINKFYSNDTFNPENVGLVYIYMELCEETNAYDDFEHRIAYQGDLENHVVTTGEYVIAFEKPLTIPNTLTDEEVEFKPVLKDGDKVIASTFTIESILDNLPPGLSPSKYISITEEDGTFTIKKVRDYTRGNLVLTWRTIDPDSKEQKVSISMYMYN